MTLLRWPDRFRTVRLVVDRTDRFSYRWYEFAAYRICWQWHVYGFGLHVWGYSRSDV